MDERRCSTICHSTAAATARYTRARIPYEYYLIEHTSVPTRDTREYSRAPRHTRNAAMFSVRHPSGRVRALGGLSKILLLPLRLEEGDERRLLRCRERREMNVEYRQNSTENVPRTISSEMSSLAFNSSTHVKLVDWFNQTVTRLDGRCVAPLGRS